MTISRDYIGRLSRDMRAFGWAGGTIERRRELRGEVSALGRYLAGTGRADLIRLAGQAEAASDKHVDEHLDHIAEILFNEGRDSI